MPAISNDWAPALREEYKKPYYKDLFLKVNDGSIILRKIQIIKTQIVI